MWNASFELTLIGCVLSICCVGYASLDVFCDELNECAWYCFRRHSLQAVELSQRSQTLAYYVDPSRPQQWSPDIPFFLVSLSCGSAGWLALHLIKAGDVETNPGPTNTHKQVWICDICHKQIHVRKQISIRCNRIEHWVRLRCAGIRQAQYTDTWTCHLHRESRLTTHTDITTPHPSRPWSTPPSHSPPTPPTQSTPQ